MIRMMRDLVGLRATARRIIEKLDPKQDPKKPMRERLARAVAKFLAQDIENITTLATIMQENSRNIERLKQLEEELPNLRQRAEQLETLLQEIPACRIHGRQCVPHAIEWIATARANEAMLVWALRWLRDSERHDDRELARILANGTDGEHALSGYVRALDQVVQSASAVAEAARNLNWDRDRAGLRHLRKHLAELDQRLAALDAIRTGEICSESIGRIEEAHPAAIAQEDATEEAAAVGISAVD